MTNRRSDFKYTDQWISVKYTINPLQEEEKEKELLK